MPTTNYDVSELTRYRNARALYNFKNQLKINNINKTCLPEQGAPATQEVYTQRTTGGMARIVDSKEAIAACCSTS
jgi:hypothetical protein